MHEGIAHNAVLSNARLPHLELRFNQSDDLPALGEKRPHDGQHLIQRDECHVDRGKIKRNAKHLRRHIADIGTLHVDDSRIRTQLPIELTVADIDRIDARGAVLQHTVGESARRRADVRRRLAREYDAERLYALGEL